MKELFTFSMIMMVLSCVSKSEPTPTNESSSKEDVVKTVYSDISVEEFKKEIIEFPNAVILDVRTPEETKEGMVPGAIEIDYNSDSFETKINELEKSKRYYVYCRSGGRSASASSWMVENGFTDVVNILGGYNAYSENN